ncbi:cyclodeaminase [Roseovarius pelagicus]|uniref:Cyclodeaminase n=1 Tax=Roseovarius pelagicus TaxID=2980108 RepID=A0ABY6D6A6_9RHOB|nr:cyclodeaminase [Roseovarius pelagicus]UXX81677.1 cyclodeaminase [Roseovarius pelagicus]
MPHDIRVLTETQLRGAVGLDMATVQVIERAFAALARGEVIMPPILSMDLEKIGGEFDVKTAYIDGLERFALKASTGFFGNAALGLPSLGGLMMVFSAKTGQVEAVLLDNGYLTDIRTAAAGAVAAMHLAPVGVRTAGVLGTGLQARLQLRAAQLVRPFEDALVWGRDPAKAEACAREMAETLGVPVRAVTDPADLVAQSQLVITTTPSRTPLITADMLHPCLHITAMGSDAEGKTEVAPKALIAADTYYCDRVSQCRSLGELRGAIEAGLWDRPDPPELGQVIIGEREGRTEDDEITICDLTGTGAHDTAIATHVMDLLSGGDVGTVVRT